MSGWLAMTMTRWAISEAFFPFENFVFLSFCNGFQWRLLYELIIMLNSASLFIYINEIRVHELSFPYSSQNRSVPESQFQTQKKKNNNQNFQ